MRSRQRRGASRLRRQHGQRTPKKRILVLCEGTKTEPLYLEAVARSSASAIFELVVEGQGADPRTLVKSGAERRKEAERAKRRTSDPNELIDAVWCVFDVDSHPAVVDACRQAAANNVECAISNPCFEIWLLLHFQDHTAFVDRGVAVTTLRQHLPTYKKGSLILEDFAGRYVEARTRCQRLDDKHKGDGTALPDNNPSSGVWRLVDLIEGDY